MNHTKSTSNQPKSVIKPQLDRMEGRIAKVEDRLDAIDRAVIRMDENMKHLATKAEIAKLPSRYELYAIMIGILAIPQLPNILGILARAMK